MASELLVKRLLKQAGVSVLAGLLMSSAVVAEDNAAPAGDDGVSVSVDGGPDVAVDPAPGDWGGDDGGFVDGSDGGDDGSDDGSDDGAGIDDGGFDGSGIGDGIDDGGMDGGADDGATDDGATDGEEGSDDGAIGDDDGMISLDPREWDGTFNDDAEAVQNTMADGPVAQPTRGNAPNQRGDHAAQAGGVSHERDGSDARMRWEQMRKDLR